ncbi:MAG: class I SAM-dependent methyltransferase [Desulfovibrio sp.]|nr:class I SAM-dependent methyltransferase [Desulfovibrio sp.]
MFKSNFFLRLLPQYRNISVDKEAGKRRKRHALRYKSLLFNNSADRIEYPYAVSYHPDCVDIRDCERFNIIRSNFLSFIAGNEINNSGDIHRFYSLIFNIEQLKKYNIQGDFAELGIYKGNTSAVLAYYANDLRRRHFLLDTFEGFHTDDIKQQKHKGFFSDTNIIDVKKLVGYDKVCTYIQGRFPDSITEDLASRRFCFVSIDCDLYNPTKAGLEFFFPRMEKGGYLFIHDYNSPYWQEECTKAVNEFCAKEEKNLVLLPDKSGTAVLIK